MLVGCGNDPTELSRVRSAGEIRIAVRSVPDRALGTPVHLARDLTSRFAKWLGVRATYVENSHPKQARQALTEGEADLAALGDGLSSDVRNRFPVSPRIRTIDHVLVYRRKGRRPHNSGDLNGRLVHVTDGQALKAVLADPLPLTIRIDPESDHPALLAALWQREIELTATTSEYLRSFQFLYPELATAFSLKTNVPVHWNFRGDSDDSLRRASLHFFNQLRRQGELDRVIHAHLGHLKTFDYVDLRRFMRSIQNRLPRFRTDFELAAKTTDLDWRWLAAVGYQESHWKPDAISPTGVRGIMMLTQATAKELGVDRDIPKQSIFGAARHLERLAKRLSPSIPEAERVWFTIAAYHLGWNHVRTALKLTQISGGNPDRWIDVEKRLGSLNEPSQYGRLPSGGARGKATVTYVHNVRRYYATLQIAFSQ